MLKDKWDKYIKEYEKEYILQQEEKKKNIPMLIELFESFDKKICIPTKIYELMIKGKSEIEKELCQSFSKEQKELLEKWIVCEDNILNDMVEQAFLYGYSLANNLNRESEKFLLEKK